MYALQLQCSEGRLKLHDIDTRPYDHVFLRVSFNLGPERDGVAALSSSIAITGGLVARGEGP